MPTTSPVSVTPLSVCMRARPKSVTHSLPCIVEQQVRRLHVAMDDAVLVGVLQRFGRFLA